MKQINNEANVVNTSKMSLQIPVNLENKIRLWCTLKNNEEKDK